MVSQDRERTYKVNKEVPTLSHSSNQAKGERERSRYFSARSVSTTDFLKKSNKCSRMGRNFVFGNEEERREGERVPPLLGAAHGPIA